MALALLVTEAMQPEVADANIGGGGAWLVLSLFGLPLSLLGFVELPWGARIAIAILSAALNVGLHWWLRRRSSTIARPR